VRKPSGPPPILTEVIDVNVFDRNTAIKAVRIEAIRRTLDQVQHPTRCLCGISVMIDGRTLEGLKVGNHFSFKEQVNSEVNC